MAEKSDTRYERDFGKGAFLRNDYNFFELPIDEQVRKMGWSHACPVVDEIIIKYGDQWAKTHPGASPADICQRGAELALRRYAECNFVFGLIVDRAQKLKNEPLHEELIRPVPRLENEPDGDHGLEFVPDSHKRQMSPMSTPVGYALPRVMIEQMGRGENNIERTPERMLRALKVIDKIVKVSKTPIELIVRLSEEVAKMDADPKNVLSHLLSAGILREENCVTMFKAIVAKMRKSAPTLTEVYYEMSSAERQELGIVDLEQLR